MVCGGGVLSALGLPVRPLGTLQAAFTGCLYLGFNYLAECAGAFDCRCDRNGVLALKRHPGNLPDHMANVRFLYLNCSLPSATRYKGAARPIERKGGERAKATNGKSREVHVQSKLFKRKGETYGK